MFDELAADEWAGLQALASEEGMTGGVGASRLPKHVGGAVISLKVLFIFIH